MKLSLRNLGPIKDGEIELSDLTVFIGKPNSGKSTAMKAIFLSLFFPPRLITLKIDNVSLNNNPANISFSINREEIISNFNNFIKDSLPQGGEFKLHPVNVLDFVLNNKLSYKESTHLTFSQFFLPSKCSDSDIKNIRDALEKTKYNIEINGEVGKVSFNLGLDQEHCLNDEDFIRNISSSIINEIENKINLIYSERFYAKLKEMCNISCITYIPYGRSLLILEKMMELEEAPEDILSKIAVQIIKALNPDFKISRPYYFSEYFNKLNQVKLNDKIYKIVKPLLHGDFVLVKDKLIYEESGEYIPWKYVSSSVLEIISLLLSLGEGEMILYEEPETQFHEELQLLIAMILYSLSATNHIVISTHSQTITYTLSHLSLLKPTKEEVKELFKSLGLTNYEDLAEAIEFANKKPVNIKFYHFDKGKVREVSAEEVNKGMPGTQDVLEKEFKWFSSLYSKRIFGENTNASS
jgi:hypothetical protein